MKRKHSDISNGESLKTKKVLTKNEKKPFAKIVLEYSTPHTKIILPNLIHSSRPTNFYSERDYQTLILRNN